MNIPFRQVHLDFHTSEHIMEVGKFFDAEKFADTVKKASIDSMTLFSRCHHGWLYYNSPNFPERIHPNLVHDNLLNDQVSALHSRSIKAPIYVTVQWDNYTVDHHPEWLVRDENGNPVRTYNETPNFYTMLCLNTEFKDFVITQTLELFDVIDKVDGLFFDTIFPVDCHCSNCLTDMQRRDFDISDKHHRMQYSQQLMDRFKHEMSSAIHNREPECTIFYNTPQVGHAQKEVLSAFTHLEIESLPSGNWGYFHFPATVRYARKLGLEVTGMTGKFHSSWGDFNSFKNKAALEYECFRSLSLNARCSIGDQLDPGGLLSQATYDLIGSVYRQVEEKEPWCINATPVTEIAILNPEEFLPPGEENCKNMSESLLGAVQMLKESQHQFDIIDSDHNLSEYKVLILADEIRITRKLQDRISTFIHNGGKVIASYQSGLNNDDQFALAELKVTCFGQHPREPNFIELSENVAEQQSLHTEPYVMYRGGLAVDALESGRVEIKTVNSYFNRTEAHYCSHKHTPCSGEISGAAAVSTDNSWYFSHPLFKLYQESGAIWCKKIFLHALNELLPEPVIKQMPYASLEATINYQPDRNRHVIHLLHYIPEKKCEKIFTIEDVIPINNLDISFRPSQASNISSIKLQPQNRNLDYALDTSGYVDITVPELNGHQIIEISYQ